MALLYRLSFSSSSSPLSSACNSIKQFNPINPKSFICSLHFNDTSSSSSSSSPFTEKHSFERYQRDQWVYSSLQHNRPEPTSPSVSLDADSTRRNDIALQLPELKKLLQVLREKREEDRVGAEKCGPGNVYLVGTGPGDPDLLTLKAMKVIQKADLLLYDRLVSNDVLDLVAPNARLLYVGKTAGYHSRTQVFNFLPFFFAFFLFYFILF